MLCQQTCWISSGLLWYSSVLLDVIAELKQRWHEFADVGGLIRCVGGVLALRLGSLPSGRVATGRSLACNRL